MMTIARLKKLIFLSVAAACVTPCASVQAGALVAPVETISAQVGAPASVTVRGETRQQEIDSPPMMMQVALLANAPMTARAASAPAFQLESLRDDVFGSREARPAGGNEAYGLHLPEPGTGSALLATAALMAFFFLRRSAR